MILRQSSLSRQPESDRHIPNDFAVSPSDWLIWCSCGWKSAVTSLDNANSLFLDHVKEKAWPYMCTTCGKLPGMHKTVHIGDANPRENQCCACYVRGGGAPADWHPLCMESYAKTLEPKR